MNTLDAKRLTVCGSRALGNFSWPPAIAQQVASAMLEDEAWYDGFNAESCKTLAARSQLAKDLLDEAGIG